MSYCRWSDDDFQCDVYCYADVLGGYTTHVAENRPVLDGTLPPAVPFEQAHLDAWVDRYKKLMEWVNRAERQQIVLPYDGEQFHDPDPASAADRLQMLREAGYNVPQHAIDALRAEANADREQGNA